MTVVVAPDKFKGSLRRTGQMIARDRLAGVAGGA